MPSSSPPAACATMGCQTRPRPVTPSATPAAMPPVLCSTFRRDRAVRCRVTMACAWMMLSSMCPQLPFLPGTPATSCTFLTVPYAQGYRFCDVPHEEAHAASLHTELWCCAAPHADPTGGAVP